MHVKVRSNPMNPRDRAAHLDALGDSLARINQGQVARIDAPCCAPCAGVSLKRDDALKDAASLVSDGYGGPVSIVAYAMAMANKKGKGPCRMQHEKHGEAVRPVYYNGAGERRDPLAVYAGHACPCGKLKGKQP